MTARDPFDIDYRYLVEHIPAIIYIAAWDADSSTVYTSPQIEDILGFTQIEWMADPTLWRRQLHPDDHDKVLVALERLHAGGDPETLEYRMLTRGGDTRWFRDHIAIRRDDDCRPRYIYGVMFDITREKALETNLNDARRRLQMAQLPRLDARETKVLSLARDGHTDCAIGRELGLSERSVRYCVQGICEKLGVATRRAAIREAIRLGLLEM